MSNDSTIDDLNLPPEIVNHLFDHQVTGILWMYNCFLKHSGGLLGDDMGLGKTFQVTSLLCSLMRQSLIKHVVIVSPVSVLESWRRELTAHLSPYVKRINLEVISSEMPKKRRLDVLHSTFYSAYPGVVITSYQLMTNMVADFQGAGLWDYVVLDEGHLIKNSATKVAKAVHSLRSHHRLLLTGTPVQNNLEEFWCLIDWVTKGTLLGTKQDFIQRFMRPIIDGQNPRASVELKAQSQNAAKELLAIVCPVLLQRKKVDHSAATQLREKTEITVWIPLSSSQRAIYQAYTMKVALKGVFKQKTIESITHLKTICRHPLLLEATEAQRSGDSGSQFVKPSAQKKPFHGKIGQSSFMNDGTIDLNYDEYDEDETENMQPNEPLDGNLCVIMSQLNISQAARKPKAKISPAINLFDKLGRYCSIEEILAGSIKLRVLLQLTRRLHRNAHRILVFSQSRQMLDIIQRMFAEKGLASVRIDGSVVGKERQVIIDNFNKGSNNNHYETTGCVSKDDDINFNSQDSQYLFSPSICLLTTKACGCGITLTGADRVILFDPSWNPAEDRQAVDRAYRIGQTRDVYVYRFIMAGTVEEKMYEKQVFKDGVRVLTEKGKSSQYFSHAETTELFNLGPKDNCEILKRLPASSRLSEVSDTAGPLDRVLGYSRHDALYLEPGTLKATGDRVSKPKTRPIPEVFDAMIQPVTIGSSVPISNLCDECDADEYDYPEEHNDLQINNYEEVHPETIMEYDESMTKSCLNSTRVLYLDSDDELKLPENFTGDSNVDSTSEILLKQTHGSNHAVNSNSADTLLEKNSHNSTPALMSDSENEILVKQTNCSTHIIGSDSDDDVMAKRYHKSTHIMDTDSDDEILTKFAPKECRVVASGDLVIDEPEDNVQIKQPNSIAVMDFHFEEFHARHSHISTRTVDIISQIHHQDNFTQSVDCDTAVKRQIISSVPDCYQMEAILQKPNFLDGTVIELKVASAGHDSNLLPQNLSSAEVNDMSPLSLFSAAQFTQSDEEPDYDNERDGNSFFKRFEYNGYSCKKTESTDRKLVNSNSSIPSSIPSEIWIKSSDDAPEIWNLSDVQDLCATNLSNMSLEDHFDQQKVSFTLDEKYVEIQPEGGDYSLLDVETCDGIHDSHSTPSCPPDNAFSIKPSNHVSGVDASFSYISVASVSETEEDECFHFNKPYKLVELRTTESAATFAIANCNDEIETAISFRSKEAGSESCGELVAVSLSNEGNTRSSINLLQTSRAFRTPIPAVKGARSRNLYGNTSTFKSMNKCDVNAMSSVTPIAGTSTPQILTVGHLKARLSPTSFISCASQLSTPSSASSSSSSGSSGDSSDLGISSRRTRILPPSPTSMT